jgi:hypothetical protein
MSRKRKLLSREKLRELERIIVEFTDEHHISGSETVYQRDSVIINAYELIDKLTGIVGYYQYPEDPEESSSTCETATENPMKKRRRR